MQRHESFHIFKATLIRWLDFYVWWRQGHKQIHHYENTPLRSASQVMESELLLLHSSLRTLSLQEPEDKIEQSRANEKNYFFSSLTNPYHLARTVTKQWLPRILVCDYAGWNRSQMKLYSLKNCKILSLTKAACSMDRMCPAFLRISVFT